MFPFADYTDVQGIWRTLTDQEIITVSARIAEASQMIRDEVPLVNGMDVDERITAGTLNAATVKNVVVSMVERVVVPARFVRQESSTVDDGSESRTIDSSVSSGEMFISSNELRRLMGRRVVGRQVAFMVNPMSGSWT
jgi:predicted polyphosphate/ATP-dependent NAD kinase